MRDDRFSVSGLARVDQRPRCTLSILGSQLKNGVIYLSVQGLKRETNVAMKTRSNSIFTTYYEEMINFLQLLNDQLYCTKS